TPPRWLTAIWADVSSAFAIRDLGAEVFKIDTKEMTPYGANYALRLAEQRAFSYDPNLGKKLEFGLLNEETTVIQAIIESGQTGWWVPDASVDHFIPKERQTLTYLRNYYAMRGRTAQQLHPAQGPSWFGCTRWVLRRALQAEIA